MVVAAAVMAAKSSYFILTKHAPFIKVRERCHLSELKDKFLRNNLEDNIFIPNPVEIVAVGLDRPYLGDKGLPYQIVTKSGNIISIRSEEAPFDIFDKLKGSQFPDIIFYDASEILCIYPYTPNLNAQDINKIQGLSQLLKTNMNVTKPYQSQSNE
ncbi:MAG: hypothetical protein [Caudoviricetes sp.]|nr:MAG: hypothetical protein [Caudoviricetes sp.]